MLSIKQNIARIRHYGSLPIMRVLFLLVIAHLPASPLRAETVTQLDSIRYLVAQLSPTQQADINQQCASLQHQNNRSLYRLCIQNAINPTPSSDMSAFDALTFDDKYAVQQACATDRRDPELTYQACLQLEVAELSIIPVPVLANLNENEKYALRKSCFDTQTKSGAAAHRLCLNNELEQLSQIAEADLSLLSVLDRNAIQLACSTAGESRSAAAYRQCLSQELHNSLKTTNQTQKTTPDSGGSGVVSIATNKIEYSAKSVTGPEIYAVAEKPVLMHRPLVKEDTVDIATAVNSVTGAQAIAKPPSVGAITDTRTSSLNSPRGLLERLTQPSVLMIAIPLILVLACFKLLHAIRRSNRRAPLRRAMADSTLDVTSVYPFGDWELPEHPASSTRGSDAQKKWTDTNEKDDDFLTDLEQENTVSTTQDSLAEIDPDFNLSVSFDAPPDTDLDATGIIDIDQDATLALSETEILKQLDHSQPSENIATHTAEGDNLTVVTPPALKPLSDFGRQLSQLGASDRKRQTTEFLLYWISYGDKKYDPDKAAYIIENDSVDEHDLIKKWVLLKDASALTDALRFLTRDFSDEEIRHTINLLLAVLVQSVPTPVQNTLLRFIADFVGIGSVGLNRQYKILFAQELPMLPRPDSPRWWAQQEHLRGAPTENENLALLGLDDNATRQDVIDTRTQLSIRFDPALFSALGNKQQALVGRYADRYSRACAELLQETET